MSAIVTSIICGLLINISIFYITKKILNSNVELFTIKSMVLILLLSMVYAIFYNEGYSMLYIISNYLSIMLFNKVIFRENMKQTILSTIIALLIVMIADFINSMIIINFFSLNQIRVCWYIRILRNIIVSIISVLLSRIKPIQEKCKYFIKQFDDKKLPVIVLFIILILSIIAMTFNISKNLIWNVEYFTNLFIILTLIFFCYIFINEDNEFHKLNDEYDSLFKCIQTFEEWIEREQLNRHEYKNQLASLRCVTKEKKVKDKIDSIINDNININSSTVNQLKPIPNGGLKGLLYYKIVIAQNNKLNIELDIILKHPNLIKNISEDSMKIICKLVGIYMDNAIEAAVTTSKKIVCLEIYEIEKEINIVISNSFNKTDNFNRRNEKGYSTKGKGRGNGLYFAKKMISKCNWIAEEQSMNNGFYIQKLIIKPKSNIYKN